MLARPKAILFDWDNTLADTWPVIYAALTATFKAMGHEPWTFEEVKSGRDGIHHSLRDSFPRIFGEQWEDARKVYFQHFLDNHLDLIEKLPDTDDILNHISNDNIYLAIVSNKTGKHLRTEVNHLGWTHHFSKIIGATDAEMDKPSPLPLYMALEGSSLVADQNIWFVGDSATDVECAINASVQPVIYNNPELHDKISDTYPDQHIIHISGHNEFLKILGDYK